MHTCAKSRGGILLEWRRPLPERGGLGKGHVDAGVDHMPSTHEGRARRAAHGLDVVVHELDAVVGDRVDVGRPDLLRAVEGDVVESQILEEGGGRWTGGLEN